MAYRQISLKDTFSDCQNMFLDDAPSFFQLLDEHFDIREFIPSVFTNAFYQHFGRKRLCPLTGFLSALILQKILSIPSDSLLILFLSLCKELRISVASLKYLTLPYLLGSARILNPSLSLCSDRWLIIQRRSASLIDSSLTQNLQSSQRNALWDGNSSELYDGTRCNT